MAPVDEVREVTKAEVPAVVDLVTRVLAEFGLVFGVGAATDDHLHHLPGSYTDGGGIFWVAFVDGSLAGTCGVYPIDAETYELRKMYLWPTTRGLGVGTRLLALSVDWTRAQGGKRLVLDTIEQMTAAIRFYEANGFVRDDAQKRGPRCSRGYRLDLPET
jgi:putative acetyltransferase